MKKIQTQLYEITLPGLERTLSHLSSTTQTQLKHDHCASSKQRVCVCVLNCVQLFPTSWMVTDHDHLSMGFPGKNARADCHFLLQGIFPTHGLNQHLLHWHVGSLLLNQQGIDFVKTTKSIGENSPVEYCPSGTFSISQVFQS